MISRIFIKNNLSFQKIELEFSDGLNVFTGISGAGKSVLIDALLSVFGLKESSAELVEADAFCKLDLADITDEEPNVFKMLKQSSTRYFINSQSISKKALKEASKNYIKYLGAKESLEFENKVLLELLDNFVDDKKFSALKLEFESFFKEFLRTKEELEKIKNDEIHLEELKELASFEIEKISKINPKIGELEELSELKKRLSKKDKIESAWAQASGIFSYESAVIKALELCEIDTSAFSDVMNELRNAHQSLSFDDLSDDEIEKILDRIEALNSLDRRYGSIEAALETLKVRKTELEKYEKIEFEKADLEKKIAVLDKKIISLSQEISKNRAKVLPKLEKNLNEYLNKLYMPSLALSLESCDISALGADKIEINLNKASLKNISSGELNRLRLAFIAVKAQFLKSQNAVLILDEIDANLSGKEAMSIANVLESLAKNYQIFAISHQPQLSSKANSHFLVEKIGGISSVKRLENDEREHELARMISGEQITKEAFDFAKKLLD